MQNSLEIYEHRVCFQKCHEKCVIMRGGHWHSSHTFPQSTAPDLSPGSTSDGSILLIHTLGGTSGLNTWAQPPSGRQIQTEFLPPSFSLVQPWLLQASGEQTVQWIGDFSSHLPTFQLTQNKLLLKGYYGNLHGLKNIFWTWTFNSTWCTLVCTQQHKLTVSYFRQELRPDVSFRR